MTTNDSTANIAFLTELEAVIRSRRTATGEKSYTKTLFDRGTPYIAQKVGEEAVELAIAAVQGDKARTVSEAADLMYHLLKYTIMGTPKNKDIDIFLYKRFQVRLDNRPVSLTNNLRPHFVKLTHVNHSCKQRCYYAEYLDILTVLPYFIYISTAFYRSFCRNYSYTL